MSDGPDDTARIARHLAVLQELSELGMTLARAVTEQALAQVAGDTPAAGDPALMFSRISRAVRMTIAQEGRLGEELASRRVKAKAVADLHAGIAARAPVAEREATVHRAVARAIRLDTHNQDDEDLLEALDAHLDDWSESASFLDRPIGELVGRICKDLGVAANPSLWEDEDWAVAETAAQAESQGPPPDPKGDIPGGGGWPPDLPRPARDPPARDLQRPLGA